MLIALAAIWGSSFMFIKVAVRQFHPEALVFGRLAFAVLALALAPSSAPPVGNSRG
jgi:drug/metabolite transporter (DMT)-like permease